MFGQPALTFGQNRAESQCEALLSEKRIAAVTAAEAGDLVVRRNVGDNRLLRITRPVIYQVAYKKIRNEGLQSLKSMFKIR